MYCWAPQMCTADVQPGWALQRVFKLGSVRKDAGSADLPRRLPQALL